MKFSIGDVVIVIWSKNPLLVGEEVTIVSELWEGFDGVAGYDVAFADGDFGDFQAKNLRKKKPPEEIGNWKDCIWQPEGVIA